MSLENKEEKVSLKDQVAIDMAESFMEDLMPKIKKFIPIVKKKVEEGETFCGLSEAILIGKNSGGKIIVAKFDRNDYEPFEVFSKVDGLKIKTFTLDSLIEMMLDPKATQG